MPQPCIFFTHDKPEGENPETHAEHVILLYSTQLAILFTHKEPEREYPGLHKEHRP